jgi:hypothetical protein
MHTLPISTPPIASGSIARRRWIHSRFGQVFAAIALLLQIALPGSHALERRDLANGASEFSTEFDEHALCRARNAGNTEGPGDQAPVGDHHGFAACCLWHGAAGPAAGPTATLGPIAYVQLAIYVKPTRLLAARFLTGALGARAPPIRA